MKRLWLEKHFSSKQLFHNTPTSMGEGVDGNKYEWCCPGYTTDLESILRDRFAADRNGKR